MNLNRALAVLAGMIVVYCILQIAGGKISLIDNDVFLCVFENQSKDEHYTVTRKELNRNVDSIFVSKDGREFMFRRRYLGVCVGEIDE